MRGSGVKPRGSSMLSRGRGVTSRGKGNRARVRGKGAAGRGRGAVATCVSIQTGGTDDICEVCRLPESETQIGDIWHGCLCGKWYHATCTRFPGETPATFSCHKVNSRFGSLCTTRIPKLIGRRENILLPSKKALEIKNGRDKENQHPDIGSEASLENSEMIEVDTTTPSKDNRRPTLSSISNCSKGSTEKVVQSPACSMFGSPVVKATKSLQISPTYKEPIPRTPIACHSRNLNLEESHASSPYSHPHQTPTLPGLKSPSRTISDLSGTFGTPNASQTFPAKNLDDSTNDDSLDDNSDVDNGNVDSTRTLSPRAVRTQEKRILPSRTLASVLKDRDPKAYAQFCLELELKDSPPTRESVERPAGCKRKRQGPTFPNQEEIDNGFFPYGVKQWKSFKTRVPTLIKKVREVVLEAKCAEACVDIIPNFESQGKYVKRCTFVSKNYFPLAQEHSEKQIVGNVPEVARAASLELSENIRRPAGPPPDQDTGALDKELEDVSCDICKRIYGSNEDNEYGDYLVGCKADRLCSSSKMFHLGCYIPMARVIIDYENVKDVEELRNVIFCSSQCRRLSKKSEEKDKEGLKKGQGRKKKKTAENENES